MTNNKGLFITFEGIEGSGKSTQLARLAKFLEKIMHFSKIRLTKEPGGTAMGDQIRRLLLDPQSKMTPLAELFLYEASRVQHMEEVIKPALATEHWVLCDRFCDATVAYQGYGRGLSLDLIERLNRDATGGTQPDITILLDCPEEEGLGRAYRRSQKRIGALPLDRLEQESKAFHHRVREGYLRLAEQHSNRFIVINASRDEEIVWRDLSSKLLQRLPIEDQKKSELLA